MSGSEQRERAQAALGHVRHAAHEMIAAAHDTLDLIDDVVSTADLGGILAGITHLAQPVFVRRPPAGSPRPGAPAGKPESDSPVEHISVR